MTRLTGPVLVAALVAALASPLAAQEAVPSLAQAQEAIGKGDNVTARSVLEDLAKQGVAEAQFLYGRLLAEGRGGPRDMDAARDWLRRAADQGQSGAALLLGQIYLMRGPDRDPVEAGRLLSQAAEAGEREAQYLLGRLMAVGDGTAADPVRALNLFRAAAEAGQVGAAYELAQIYAQGKGTAPDEAEALRWLTIAADAGLAEAQFYLGLAYDRGTGVAQSDEAALRWYRRSAEGGFVLAQRALGLRYLNGEGGTEANPTEALRWLDAAVRAGDGPALVVLGVALAEGTRVPPDPAQGIEMLQSGSSREYAPATLALAGLFESGTGVAADFAQAVALYRKAAEQGSGEATLVLGHMAGQGKLDGVAPPHFAAVWAVAAAAEGDADALAYAETRAAEGLRPAQSALGRYLLTVPERTAEGVALLQKAAEADDVPAQFALASALASGTGTEVDLVRAHQWFNTAAALGHHEAAARRDALNAQLTPEQVAEAQALARAHFDAIATQFPPVPGASE